MSSPPPQPPPTAADPPATADFLKSVSRQRPRKNIHHPSIYQTFYNPQQQQQPPFPPPQRHQQPPPSRNHHQQSPAPAGGGIPYPVASSGRGLVPNSDGYPPRHVSGGYPYHRAYGFPNSDVSGQNLTQSVNTMSAHLQQQSFMGAGGVIPTSGSVSAHHKVVGQPSIGDDNSLKNIREKNGDDSFVIIRDRKVQVSEGTSLYAQCRSWLKNGVTVENQPQYADCVKSLPKPLPASMVEPIKEDDTEIDERTEDVENMSAKELLQLHVNHAKKVRMRLKNQRLQKIERYKERLALLIPPVADQQPKNDPSS
ncbi:uncharacterized protein [Rutidosis leptorrhynchoides]|uniref:uncharacterized protein n=1 Tax=Rutidosis leptorrhynchoides TaxID=125765 RepID=UPI003A9A2931